MKTEEITFGLGSYLAGWPLLDYSSPWHRHILLALCLSGPVHRLAEGALAFPKKSTKGSLLLSLRCQVKTFFLYLATSLSPSSPNCFCQIFFLRLPNRCSFYSAFSLFSLRYRCSIPSLSGPWSWPIYPKKRRRSSLIHWRLCHKPMDPGRVGLVYLSGVY